MNRSLRLYWLLLVVVLGSLGKVSAQTIATGALSVSSVCAGGTISVPFTTSTSSGTFGAGNQFKVQLATASGTFNDIGSGATSPLTGTIPGGASGAGYRVRVVSTNPAVNGSNSSTSLTITAIPGPPGTSDLTYCQGAAPGALTATTSPGATLKWWGTSPSGGSSSSTAPTPSAAAVGSTNYYVSQAIGTCESTRAEITVTVSAVPAAPTTGAAPVYCQNAPASPLSATASAGASLKWYGTSPTGGTASAIAPTPLTNTVGAVTYYVSQAIGDCEGPRTSIVVTVNAKPAPPTVTTPVTVCLGTAVPALSATSGGGNTLTWYGSSATGGTGTTTAPTPATTTAGTINYYVSQKNAGGCESDRVAIAVTIKPIPAAPGVSPVGFCQNETASALTASPTSGGSLNWYGTNASGGTASATAPSPPTSATGTTTYYVSQTVDGCEGPRASLVVTVRNIPAAPNTTTPPAYCQDVVATGLVATPTSGGTLNWYGTNATGGTPSETASIPVTSAAGTTNYYVSQTVNGCEGPRTAIAVTVTSKPAVPTVTASFSYCQGMTASQLTAVVGSGGTANWYGTNPTGGTSTPAGPTPSTTNPGTTTYYVSQTVGGCESNRASISVTVYATPTIPAVSPVSLCQNITSPALSATVTGVGTLNWYGTSATGGTASTTAPIPPTTTPGITTYYVSQSINGCEGPRASLAVTVKPQPAAPTAAASLSYCQASTSVPLSASTSGSLNWYGTSATGGTASGTAPTPSTDAPGTFTYYFSQTVNGCESERANVVVSIKAKPAIPGVQDIRYCQSETAVPLTATFEAGGSLKWYSSASGPSSLTAAPTPSTQAPADFTYYVSQNGANGCESDRGAIKVKIFPIPGVPGVPTAPEVCQNTSPITLAASGESLKWYSGQTGGSALGGAPVQNTNTAGTFTFYVSQTVNLCESPRTAARVVVKPQPALPGVENKSVCQDAPEQTLAANGESLKWFDANGNGLGGAPRPSTNIEEQRVYTYSVTQTSNGCESQKAPITFTVNVTPKPTTVTPVVYCQNAAAKPLEATGQNLKWTNPYGNVTTTAPTPPTTNISTKPEGDSYFVTQTAANGCESRKTEIRLIVNAPPTAKIEGTKTVNLGNTVPVTISFTSIPPFSYTLSDGTTGTSETNQKDITLLPTKKTTIYTVTNITNSCGAGTPVGTFTVNAVIPAVTTNALSVTTICVGTQVQVPFTTSGEFTAGNTYRVELAPVADTAFVNKVEISTGAMQSPITAPIPTTVAQGLYRVRVTATNPQVPVPGSSSPTILNIRALPTVTLTGSKDIYDTQGTPISFALTGDSPWTFEYSDSLKTTKITTSTNPHVITVTPIKSTTYKVTSISNSCGTGTATGTAVIRVLPLLGLEPDPLITAVKVFPVPTQNSLTIDIDLPLQKDPARIQLTDQSGRISKELSTRQRQTKLDLSQQAAGYYFLQIQIGDRTTVRKIMKQ
ncbi:T9SS type A sorting domain-containing protein [Larkinella rosea]|uniref:T9SS C-terminal target domain-containing protein n=1 Tax=Larkinella rosea TaxID=2025312 RepID=A0A3P1BS25_9BACT|nr:T9SS type A sorting domain-containing protein [Larkinella rosea]RRB03891.1 T9SS C-terminal target domain-containing protein [Larkinella rosea]